MPRKLSARLILWGACALPAFTLAADGNLTGPVPGFVFDANANSIRPMIGMPGAAYLGNAVAQGFDAASIAPDGNAALATREGQLFLLRGLGNAEPSLSRIENAIAGTDRFAWSSDSNSAVVFASASGQLQVIDNLNKVPSTAAAMELGGNLNALIWNGTNAIAAISGSNDSGVYLVSNRGAELLARMAKPTALAFAANRSDVFAADADRQEIWLIRNFAGGATPEPFAGAANGVNSPVGLQLSSNGRLLLVANAGSRNLEAIDIATRATLANIELDFEPTRLEALGANGLALLNRNGQNEPLYVLDKGDNLAVYFVPAGREQ